MANHQRALLPLLLLLSLGLIWGSGYTIARYSMLHGVSSVGYTFWQSIGPAIILTILSYKHLKFDKRHISFYLICGLLGIAIPNTNMYFASPHLPAGLLALVVNTVPIFIYPLALFSRQEKFSFIRLVGVASAIIGVMLLVIPKAALPQANSVHWLLMALITPFCFALFALYINPRRPENSDPLSLAAGMLIAATLFITPWVFSTHQFYPLQWPLNLPGKLILLEIILSSIGYVFLFWLLKIAGPVYYSLVDGVVAFTGICWGRIIFGEHFYLLQGIAISFIFAGIFLVTVKQPKLDKY